MLYTFLAIIAFYLAYKVGCLEKQNDRDLYYKLTFFVIFFIYGFEFYNTVDYSVMLSKFNWVNNTEKSIFEFGEVVEPLCAFLLKLCQPIGGIGYYLVTAAFEIFVMYKLCKKSFDERFLWLFVFILLINFSYVITFMTLKRQFLSVSFVMLGVYLSSLESFKDKRFFSKESFYIFLCFVAAFMIHKASVGALFLLPIVFLKQPLTKKMSVFLLFLFLLQYLINLSDYADSIFYFLSDRTEKFAHYAQQLESGRSKTFVYIFYETVVFLTLLYYGNKESGIRLVLIKASLLYFVTVNYFQKDMGRIVLYYQYCTIFAIVISIENLLIEGKIKFAKMLMLMVVLISCRLYYNAYFVNDKHSMSYGFKNFETIFEAPSLWIDNPVKLYKKYLPHYYLPYY
ncbi:EpsG family protein [Fibrobacter sp.]|uniref:EpsG family protein n=1 Tax=Fibrobacter sp. TaxID=35828 RepID=UPI0025C01DCD|nr:EpsG family protein [Fibrobacter sp.]MBR3073399.1 EpsG family protein [Fibrobacter sp.]